MTFKTISWGFAFGLDRQLQKMQSFAQGLYLGVEVFFCLQSKNVLFSLEQALSSPGFTLFAVCFSYNAVGKVSPAGSWSQVLLDAFKDSRIQ